MDFIFLNSEILKTSSKMEKLWDNFVACIVGFMIDVEELEYHHPFSRNITIIKMYHIFNNFSYFSFMLIISSMEHDVI